MCGARAGGTKVVYLPRQTYFAVAAGFLPVETRGTSLDDGEVEDEEHRTNYHVS